MSTQNHMNPNELGAAERTQRPTAKKPYLKPAFRHERVFETNALTCGKISGTQGACSSNKKLS